MRRTAALCLSVVVAALAGCSDDSDQNKRSEWTAAGSERLEAVAAALAAAFDGECGEPGLNPFEMFRLSMDRFDSDVLPLAQATCDIEEEVVEITVLQSADERSQYVDDRSNGICGQALEKDVPLPGLRWITLDEVSIQPDSEGLARRIAAAVGGVYDPRPCTDTELIDWTTAAISRLEDLAGDIPCVDLSVVDRAVVNGAIDSDRAVLDLAIGQCRYRAGTIEIIAISTSTDDTPGFVAARRSQACSLTAISGPDFVILARESEAAAVSAAVGYPAEPACTE